MKMYINGVNGGGGGGGSDDDDDNEGNEDGGGGDSDSEYDDDDDDAIKRMSIRWQWKPVQFSSNYLCLQCRIAMFIKPHHNVGTFKLWWPQ